MPQMMRKLLLITILLAVSSILAAQTLLIRNIRVEGNVNIDESLILTVSKLKIGDFVDYSKVSETIKSLYALEVFEDIYIEKENISNGVEVIINVTEYPVVESVSFKGNKKYSDSGLKEFVLLRKGSYYSEFLKNKVTRQITQKYVEKAYNNVQINYDVKTLDNNRVDVTIRIDDGNKIRVNRISFHGNEEITDKKLAKKMKTKTTNLFRSGKFEQAQLEADLQAIEAYYQELGYIKAKISSHEIKTVENKFIQIDIYLNEGEQYKYGNVLITGNNFFTEEELMKVLEFDTNEPFNMEEFKLRQDQIREMYSEEGFIYSSIDPELLMVEDRVDIQVNIDEQIRAKIRKIHISGNRGTKEKIIRRQLAINPGDFFKRSQILSTQQNIYNLGFFEPNIGIEPKPINRNGDVDLYFNVEDKTSGTANGGVGYNSVDGFVGQLSLSHNNIMGNNWQSSISYEFGGSTQNVQFSFTNPYTFDTNTLSGFSLYNTKREWDDYYYEILTRGGSVRLGRPLKVVNRTQAILSYSYYSKKYSITNQSQVIANNNQSLIELDTLGWQNTSSLGLTISRDSRDNVFFPTKGSQITIYNELAGGFLGGNFDYYKFISQVSFYTETYYKFVLRNKWRFGYVTSFGQSASVPPDERFYLGGTGPDGIRGYGDRSIGPNEGGTREIIYSTELAYPIGGDQLSLLTFLDAGNSYNSLNDFNFLDFKKGAGLGIRIRTPMGLIGFDYAWNFEERTWQPHFQFGTTF
ncbi:outer membrane protein assembly factor BamA [bacterium]|nr:outer membrane protein assembly factor BamA [bacterium]